LSFVLPQSGRNSQQIHYIQAKVKSQVTNDDILSKVM